MRQLIIIFSYFYIIRSETETMLGSTICLVQCCVPRCFSSLETKWQFGLTPMEEERLVIELITNSLMVH